MQRHVRPELRQLVDIEHKTVIVKRTTGERAGIRLAQSTNRMAAEQCRYRACDTDGCPSNERRI